MLGRRLEAAATCGESACVLSCSPRLAQIKRGGKKRNEGKGLGFRLTAHPVYFPTLGTGERADGPNGAPTERVVPVGVTGGAGGTDGQTARCQVHHFFCWQDQRRDTQKNNEPLGPENLQRPNILYVVAWCGPTFFLLLGRRAAGGLVARLLSHRDGRDEAGLAAQTTLLLLLLQVLQDVFSPLVGARHRPC